MAPNQGAKPGIDMRNQESGDDNTQQRREKNPTPIW